MSGEIQVLFTTCPDQDSAQGLAAGLLEQQLAACVSVLPGLTSFYRWQGEVQQDAEVLLMIKTAAEVYPALEKYLLEQHPYEVPELLALPVNRGLPAYLDWVAHSVSGTE